MTIQTKDPEVPRELPHVELYLDDIQQILNLVAEVERKQPRTPPNDQPVITFEVGEQFTRDIAELHAEPISYIRQTIESPMFRGGEEW